MIEQSWTWSELLQGLAFFGSLLAVIPISYLIVWVLQKDKSHELHDGWDIFAAGLMIIGVFMVFGLWGWIIS